MAKVPKPELDEAIVQIARRMLNTPPKPHDEMKIGKKAKKTKRAKSKKKDNKDDARRN